MNADRLLAHYERIADAPDAIARLRRFILDLAVRGKLVPHDPNDEPASELLKRIAVETSRLIKKGEITKPGATPQPAKEEIWSVPPSWSFIPLELLAAPTGLFTDGDWVESKDQDPNGGVRLTQLADVGVGEYRDRSSRFMNAATAARLNCTFLAPGDILIARMPDPLGRACIFPGDPKPSVTVVDVAVLRLGSQDFVASYVVLAINSPQFSRNVETKAAGTTRSRISRGNLSLLPFPLPPLAEQHRIVAKVEELMALCDRLEAARAEREAARDRLAASSLARLNAPDPETFQADARFVLNALPALTTRRDQIKRFRQTILNLAVRGKLSVCGAWSEKPMKLGDVASLQNGYAFKSEWFSKSGTRLLRNANVGHGTINWDDEVRLPKDRVSEYERFRLQEGDIVVSLDRPFIVTGTKVARVSASDLPALLLQRVGRFMLSPALHRDYLFLWINSPHFTRQIDPGRSNGVPHISSKQVEAAVLFIPPIAEQHRIVAKVDKLMALCDRLVASLDATAATRFRLLDALLHEALAPVARELEAA